ncbi:O-antigen ligase family protein [Maribacter aquivivus]|uniref:O-antigen ligase family protein n=1 Tax=Maribacter aquivivus TaxID=228958 RepID=UPI002495250C|nr:O-antigen ligase family protein [Maribacter aquivivus]
MLQYVLALLTILFFMVLIFRKPTVKTYVLYILIVLPLIDSKILPLAYGFVRVFDVITLVALILFYKDIFTFNLSNNTRWGLLILTICFWTFTLLSNFYSEFGFGNYYLLYQLFSVFIYTRLIIVYCNQNWENRYKVVQAFKTGFTIALIFMALQIVFGLDVRITGLGPNVYSESTGLIRYPGVFGESQYNSQFLAMGSFIFLVLKPNISLNNKLLNYLGFITAVIFIFFAGGRSALGGFIVGLLILFFMLKPRFKVIGIFAGIIMITFYLMVSPKSGVFSRADNLGDDLEFRQEIWSETYTIIKEHPILGIGFGNFKPYISKYHQELYLEITPGEFTYFNQPENGYLKILVEQGIIAFSIFVWFIIIAISRVIWYLIQKTIEKNSIYFLSALTAWLVAFNTVYSLLDYRLLTMVGFFITMMIMYARNTIETKFIKYNTASIYDTKIVVGSLYK